MTGPPASDSKISHLVSKSVLTFAAQLVSMLAAVVTTPSIALGLGAERYGLYALLFGLIGYSSVLEMGLSFSLVKHIAEHDAKRDRSAIESLLGTVATAYVVITAILVLTLVSGRGWIVARLLRVPAPLVPMAETSLIILACAGPFAAVTTLFNATFRGLLRFEYVTAFSVVTTSVFSVGTALLVRGGAGLETLFVFNLTLTAASAFVHWLVARRIIPGLRISFRLRTAEVRRLFGFGRFMMVNQVSMVALQHLDKLLIARLLSVGMIGYYTVPFNVSQRLNTLGAATATVAFPFSSARLARGEVEELRRDYFQTARMLGWLTMTATLPVIVFAGQILGLWMNDAFAMYGTWPLRLLGLGVWAISIASLDAVCIEGSGRPRVTSLFMAATGAGNIVGIVVLTPVFGLTGVAGSVALAHLVLAGLDVWFCNRHVLELPLSRWGRAVALPTGITACVSAPILFALHALPTSLPGLVAVLTLGVAATGAVGYVVFLAPHERKAILVLAGQLLAGRV